MAEMQAKKNNLSLENQKKLQISGVVGVVSLSDKEIEVDLFDKKLMVKGEKLLVTKLNIDEGQLSVDSELICSLTFHGKSGAKGGTLKNWFK